MVCGPPFHTSGLRLPGLFATPPKPTDKQLEELKKQWAFTDAAGLKEVFCKFLTPGGAVLTPDMLY